MSSTVRAVSGALRGARLRRRSGLSLLANRKDLSLRVQTQGVEPGDSADQSVRAVSSVADIGELVRAYRKRSKLSQQAFADLAGVGRRFVSELENGKGTLEFEKVLKVAAAAGIDLVALER